MHADNNGVDVIRKTSSSSRVGAGARREELSREVCSYSAGNSATLSSLIPKRRGLVGGRCQHGWGHEERLRETLVLLQIPGQVPTAASAEPVPQSHQAVGQKG